MAGNSEANGMVSEHLELTQRAVTEEGRNHQMIGSIQNQTERKVKLFFNPWIIMVSGVVMISDQN